MLGNQDPHRIFIDAMTPGLKFVAIGQDDSIVAEGVFVSKRRGSDGRTRVRYDRADGQSVEVFASDLGLVTSALRVRTYRHGEGPAST